MPDRYARMILCGAAIVSALGATALMHPAKSSANTSYCKPGYMFTGNFRDEIVNNGIVRHPECKRLAAWTPGQWKRGQTVATVVGTCFTAWMCTPNGTIMYARGSQRFAIPTQRRTGACVASRSNPKKCGTCIGEAETPPAEACTTCIAPPECKKPNLGWRTREAMGCCD